MLFLQVHPAKPLVPINRETYVLEESAFDQFCKVGRIGTSRRTSLKTLLFRRVARRIANWFGIRTRVC